MTVTTPQSIFTIFRNNSINVGKYFPFKMLLRFVDFYTQLNSIFCCIYTNARARTLLHTHSLALLRPASVSGMQSIWIEYVHLFANDNNTTTTAATTKKQHINSQIHTQRNLGCEWDVHVRTLALSSIIMTSFSPYSAVVRAVKYKNL